MPPSEQVSILHIRAQATELKVRAEDAPMEEGWVAVARLKVPAADAQRILTEGKLRFQICSLFKAHADETPAPSIQSLDAVVIGLDGQIKYFANQMRQRIAASGALALEQTVVVDQTE